MTYRISGLPRGGFEQFFTMEDAELHRHDARRLIADSDRGFPCRVSLEDARAGERLILLPYTDHAVDTPYRNAFAIFVREAAEKPATFVDATPPVFEGRDLALRGYDAAGMLLCARLAMAGEADAVIRALFADARIAYIHAHNAAHGCFAARVERDGGRPGESA